MSIVGVINQFREILIINSLVIEKWPKPGGIYRISPAMCNLAVISILKMTKKR